MSAGFPVRNSQPGPALCIRAYSAIFSGVSICGLSVNE